MRETQAIIERVRRVSDQLQHLDLSVDAALSQLKPGQSIFARLGESWDPLLREQWVPVAIQANQVTVELPVERAYAPGQAVSLLSPVGRPLPVRPNVSQMLLVAHQAQPTPFVLLTRQLIAAGASVALVLGEDALRYPLELLPPEVEILRSDLDWTWPNRVEMLNWAEQVFVLAPPALHTEIYGGLFDTISQLRHQAIPDGYICGLFLYRLACGTGACQACQITGQRNTVLACVDGPAIDLKRMRF